MTFCISILVGIYLHALGDGDCGLDRLQPSAIRADTEYSSSYAVDNLIDGNPQTYWQSQSGDAYDNVYLDFASNVDIKHIMIKEGTYYIYQMYIYDGNTNAQMDHVQLGDTSDFKIYNFWFTEWNTDKIKIYFSGSQSSQLTVAEVSVQGCNVTSTFPTVVPTVSPSLMPTNHTPTVMPTNLPSASPTQIPTSVTPSTLPTTVPTASPMNMPTTLPTTSPTDMPTTLPTVSPTPIPTLPTASPSDMPTILPTLSPTQIPTQVTLSPTKSPTYQPSLSPSMHPTTTLVPSSSPTMTPTSTLLPTSSPTLYPTLDVELSSDDGGIADTARTDGDTVTSIGVLVTLIVLLFVMALSTLYFFCKLYRAKQQVGTLNTLAMTETYQQKDQL